MDNVKKILKEITINNPNVVRSSIAKKITNSFITDYNCLSFYVSKKLPLSELSSEEIIPSEIEVDGVVYKTDVIEEVEHKFVSICAVPGCYECYDPLKGIPCLSNANTTKPIKGGSILQSLGGYGTLGFMAVHTPTQAIVGVTNAHVVSIQTYVNSYFALYKNSPLSSVLSLSKNRPYSVPYSNTFSWYGGISFAKPIHINLSPSYPFADTIDAAIVGVYEKDTQGNTFITNTESWKQIGLSDITGGVNTPPTFASTQELDALLYLPNLEIWSSGARTGVKKTECGLTILSTDTYARVSQFAYNNLIQFGRTDLRCIAIDGGDSGSALMGKVPTYSPTDPNWKDGPRTWKILGLVFASTSSNDIINYGLACRIDNIAPRLQIEPWDGTAKHFIDIDNLIYKSIPGPMIDQTKTIDGKVYYQIGTSINNGTIFQ